MKKIFALLLFFILIGISSQVLASKLPEKELNVLTKTFPKMKVRFDGMIELRDGTSYVPVFPVQTGENITEVKVVKTIPNTALKNKPDFIMFNTNFALFKVISKNGKATIIDSADMPYEIKMGILPQDLLVPSGFEIPESMKLIAGDLIIPISNPDKDSAI